MSKVVNAVGSYCGSKVDPESSVGLRVARCISLSQNLSQLPLSHSGSISQKLTYSYKP